MNINDASGVGEPVPDDGRRRWLPNGAKRHVRRPWALCQSVKGELAFPSLHRVNGWGCGEECSDAGTTLYEGLPFLFFFFYASIRYYTRPS